jgi:hypothetical protein
LKKLIFCKKNALLIYFHDYLKAPGQPPALQREHPALQNKKISEFFFFGGHYSIILLPWSRIRGPIESGSPDPWNAAFGTIIFEEHFFTWSRGYGTK